MKIQSVLTPTALLVTLILGLFTSCQKDECNPDPWGIVGNWSCEEEYKRLENGIEVFSAPQPSSFYSFSPDGTGTTIRGGVTYDIAWYYSSAIDQLIFYTPGVESYTYNCNLQSQDQQSITLVDSSFFTLQLPNDPVPVRHTTMRTFTMTRL